MNDFKRVVLITAPSLEVSRNVSGVASVVRGIVTGFSEIASPWQIVPHLVGKPDGQKRGAGWLAGQLAVPVRLAAAIRAQQPRIVHVNGPLNGLAIFRDALLIALARRLAPAVIYHLHGGRYIAEVPNSGAMRLAVRTLLGGSGPILVLGAAEAEQLHSVHGVDRHRITVLENAVPLPDTMAPRPPDERLNLLSIGRLSEEKGLHVLCEAFEVDPDLAGLVRLEMFGAGPLEAELRRRLETALGSAYRFGGVAAGAEKVTAYDRADVVVMPSLRGEGLPMVLLEAMAAGAVPATTDDGLMATLVVPGDTGFRFPKQDARALAKTLREAAALKRMGRLAELAQAARARIAQGHGFEHYVRRLEEIYAEVDRCDASQSM